MPNRTCVRNDGELDITEWTEADLAYWQEQAARDDIPARVRTFLLLAISIRRIALLVR